MTPSTAARTTTRCRSTRRPPTFGVIANLTSTGAVFGGLGADRITLGTVENLVGTDSFADTLVGNDVRNVLSGLGGDDTLRGGLGDDLFDGGSGDDTVAFNEAAATSRVIASLAAGAVTGGLGSDTITLGTVENLTGTN